jgi:hypothetical protein
VRSVRLGLRSLNFTFIQNIAVGRQTSQKFSAEEAFASLMLGCFL